MSKETVKFTVSEGKAEREDFQVTDPIRELNLFDHAYRVDELPMENTDKDLEGLGLKYYVVLGGEILSKEVNEKGDGVIFNKGRKDEFEIPLDKKAALKLDGVDIWYSKKPQATAICKAYLQQQLKKSKELLDKHSKANAFLEQQLDQNMIQ